MQATSLCNVLAACSFVRLPQTAIHSGLLQMWIGLQYNGPQASNAWDDGAPLDYIPSAVALSSGACYAAVCDISQPSTQFCYWEVRAAKIAAILIRTILIQTGVLCTKNAASMLVL